jgi:hypothetical protein
MGKGTHRAAWIAGTAAVATGVVAAILLLKEKSANAAPNSLPPGPSGPQPTTPVQQAAADMAADLKANGYKLSSQGLYQAFQSAAGLSPVDGFPGTNTMHALATALTSYGAAYPFNDGYTGQPIIEYAWLSTCAAGSGDACYNGQDAPQLAEWQR